ncbi:SIMPL domain-containing protein [Candidatus Daviesbacteria bacterium]|nr:SIMPL domain-containing protein [Candidatus Daviesbacteria bacterium]
MNSRILLLPVIGALSVFTLLFVYTKLVGPIPFSVNSVTTTKSDTFNVSGEGKVTVSPDIATVSVGVRAQAQTVKAAQDQLNSSINQVIAAIKQLGIDEKDIKTTNYNINPDYDYTTGSQRIRGYTASSNVTVKVRDLDKVNNVIDVSTTNGANQIYGISFDVDDKTKAENEAREKAVADAKSKAEAAARIAGFRLGRMVNYSEGFTGGPIPYPARIAVGAAEVADSTQVEPGSSEITVTVTLSYEIN